MRGGLVSLWTQSTPLAAALILAGCLTAPAGLTPQSIASLNASAASIVSASAGGLVATPPSLANLAAAVFSVATGAEPTIGVTSDGAIFTTGGGAAVWKSSDNGRTWSNVAPTLPPRADADPYLWVDRATDRVFSAPLYVACTNLAWSDDRGATWSSNPIAGCGLPGHDHQSLVTGPPPTGVKTNGYGDVVYYTYNSFRRDGTWVTTSLDGGKTWSFPGAQVAPDDTCDSALDGAPAVAPDGTVIVPKPTCQGMYITASKDAGMTWRGVNVDGAGTDGAGEGSGAGLAGGNEPYYANPGAGFDLAGNGYVAFAGKDGQMYVTRSTDDAATWSAPVRLTPPQITATAFSALQAGGPGDIAVAYLGTTRSTSDWHGKAAQWATNDTKWNLYITYSEDATSATPTFTTLEVTHDDNPVQMGCIWQSGGSNPCRNLDDFIGMAQHEGRIYVAFSKGCEQCTSAADSHHSDLKVAIVTSGPSLENGLALPALGP
ncbi:MAG: sialidase family protein [Thermoplasmatota archaeon]